MSLRQWMNVVQLHESLNTDGMVASIEKAWATTKGGDAAMNQREGERRIRLFNDGMKWARKTLSRADRIAWYARWLRIAMFYGTSDFYPALKEYADRFGVPVGHDGITNADGEYLHHGYDQTKYELQHLLSLNYQPILDVKWTPQLTPTMLFSELHQLEQRYREAQKVFIPYEDENEILVFPDGYRWVNLERGECSLEAEAMGHCGNAGADPDGDTILSLRQIVTKNGVKYWRPSLTFVLDTSTGMLGEMKGRANSKPKAVYHPHIVGLLRLPIIKGIKGGGYKPENNFSLADLDPEVREELILEKPSLLSPTEYYKRFGLTEDLKRRLEIQLTNGRDGPMTWHGDTLILNKRKPWRELAKNFGTGYAIHLLHAYDDPQTLVSELTKGRLLALLKAIPSSLSSKVNLLLGSSKGFIDPKLMDCLTRAHRDGRVATITRRLETIFANTIDGFDDGFYVWRFENGGFTNDGHLRPQVNLKRLLDQSEDGGYTPNAMIIPSPTEPWDDPIDGKVAADVLRRTLHDHGLL